MFTRDFVYIQVVASGLWLAPGDSEEVAAALSQALRSRIERFLSFLSIPDSEFNIDLISAILSY